MAGEPVPVDTSVAEHYRWGEGCDGWHLVRAEGLSVIEERMPPGTAETRHRHARSRQLFYLLAGELTIEVEGRSWTLAPRQAVEVSPGAAHQVMNRGAEAARFLVVSQPPSHGDREAAPAT